MLGSHNYRLDTPPGIHNVFHTRLLRPVKSNPLPGQRISDPQPPAILVDDEEEYEIEKILDQKAARGRNAQQYLIKWKGYDHPTWEPQAVLTDSIALDVWEEGIRSGTIVLQPRRRPRRREEG